jgi:hypothetical protein
LKAEQKKGKLRSDLVDILTDLTICYTDKELWRFLAKFGEPILKDISPSEEPATDKELKVAKTLESYKKARDSTVHIAKRSVIIIYSNLLNYFNLCTFDGFSNCNSSIISSTEPELLLP